MWHVFYRSIYGTVARAYNGTFNVCPLGISRELCEGVNRSVVVGSLNQVIVSLINKINYSRVCGKGGGWERNMLATSSLQGTL